MILRCKDARSPFLKGDFGAVSHIRAETLYVILEHYDVFAALSVNKSIHAVGSPCDPYLRYQTDTARL